MAKRLPVGLLTVMLLFLGTGLAQPAATPTITSTRLTLSSTSTSWGDTVTLSADVSASGNSVNVGGVLFLEDGVAFATVQVVGNSPALGFRTGSATLKRSFSSGTHKVTARFLGCGLFASSTSDAVPLLVADGPPQTINIASAATLPFYVHFDLTSGEPIPADGLVNLFNVVTSNGVGSVSLSHDVARQVDRVTSFSSSGLLSSFVLGDFNGDGLIDVAVTDGETLKIYSGTQSGIGLNAAFLSYSAEGAAAVVTGDVNGDGVLDLITINALAGSLTVWLGDPDHPGSFVAVDAPIALEQGITGLVLTDLNADGLLDIAVTNAIEGSVTILLSLPTDPGHFVVSQTLPLSGGPYAVAAGDLFGTGFQDLAVASYLSGEVWVFQNNPNDPGTFIVPNRVQKVGNGPSSILIADVTGDGIPDIVVCDSLDNEVSILAGIPSTRGVFPSEQILEVGSEPISLALAGATVKGNPNLVVSNSQDGTLEVLENDDTGGFQNRRVISVGPSSSQVSAFSGNGASRPVLITLDPDANLIHLAQQLWWAEGTFSDLPMPSKGQAMKLQALVVSGSGQTLSNQLTLTSVGTSQTISFEPMARGVYGQSLPLLATASSGLPVQFHIAAGSATIAGDVLIPSSVGSITVEASQAGDDVYAAAPAVSKTIQIGPAVLRVVAASAERAFGALNPQFTGNMIGLVAGDPVQVSFASSANELTPPGVYEQPPVAVTAILQDSENRLQNYTVTLSTAPLTILAASKSSDPVDKASPVDVVSSLTPPSEELDSTISLASALPGSSVTGAVGTNPTSQTPPPILLVATSNVAPTPVPISASPIDSTMPVTSPSAPTIMVPPSTATPPVDQTGVASIPSTAPSLPIPPPGSTNTAAGTLPSASPAPITTGEHDPAPITTGVHDPSPTGNLPAGTTTPVRLPSPIHIPSSTHTPISLSFTLPTISIHSFFVPIPLFGWPTHEAKRLDPVLVLTQERSEAKPGEVHLKVHFGSSSRSPALGEVVVIEEGRRLAQSYIDNTSDVRMLLHGVSLGHHTLVARYSGDARFPPAISNALEIDLSSELLGEGTSLPPNILSAEQSTESPHPPREQLTPTIGLQEAWLSIPKPPQSYFSSTSTITTSSLAALFSTELEGFTPHRGTLSYFSESAALAAEGHPSSALSAFRNRTARRGRSRGRSQTHTTPRSLNRKASSGKSGHKHISDRVNAKQGESSSVRQRIENHPHPR